MIHEEMCKTKHHLCTRYITKRVRRSLIMENIKIYMDGIDKAKLEKGICH